MKQQGKEASARGVDSTWEDQNPHQKIDPKHRDKKIHAVHALLWKNPSGMTADEIARKLGLEPDEAGSILDTELASQLVGALGEERGHPIYTTRRHGDKLGEHYYMTRGEFHAGLYVRAAFLIQVSVICCASFVLLVSAAELLRMSASLVVIPILVLSLLFGVTGAYLLFRDRWRCIEAFSSRFCSGILNMSVLYVPIIALVYANVRGVKKLFGK